MRTVTAVLQSSSPYSQSRKHFIPKQDKEPEADYDLRTWRDKCTANTDGIVCIPGMAIKMALDSAARKLQEKIPGKGRKTWIEYFLGGVIPSEAMFPIGVKKNEIEYIDAFCDVGGQRGGGRRVLRRFPIVTKWAATVVLDIIDDYIQPDVFERHLIEAGKVVGIGRFRPENGGFNGRFTVKSVKWSSV